MAVIETVTESAGASGDLVYTTSWSTITNADTCEAARHVTMRDRCIQVEGTFGSATVTIKGSNDGTNYEALKDIFGNALTFTAAGIKQVGEMPLAIQPTIAGGGGTQSLTITMVSRRGFG